LPLRTEIFIVDIKLYCCLCFFLFSRSRVLKQYPPLLTRDHRFRSLPSSFFSSTAFRQSFFLVARVYPECEVHFFFRSSLPLVPPDVAGMLLSPSRVPVLPPPFPPFLPPRLHTPYYPPSSNPLRSVRIESLLPCLPSCRRLVSASLPDLTPTTRHGFAALFPFSLSLLPFPPRREGTVFRYFSSRNGHVALLSPLDFSFSTLLPRDPPCETLGR